MELSMKVRKEKLDVDVVSYLPLIRWQEGYYVLASHRELDDLVGSLMQMCELMGDKEQRDALKREIKQRARNWLDIEYQKAGYDKFTGLNDSVKPKQI